MLDGVLDFNAWQIILVGLGLTHITIVAVTVFLHRAQAHRGLDLHPALSHFFRFWLWLTTGMVTAEWVAVHRRHHARCETEEDPHSPQILGLNKVLWEGAELYRDTADNVELVERYSHGTPDDWLEKHVYGALRWQGVGLMLIVNFILFGVLGIALWAVQMIWIPFWAAGVINGIGHFWGYRNFESPDAATNIVPFGLLIGGEELHNNHHAFPSSAKFSVRWWEFDLGWLYIKLFTAFRLAQVRRVAQQPRIDGEKTIVDMETVKAVVTHRMHVLARYARDVVKPVAVLELCRDEKSCRKLARQARRLLVREESTLDARSKARLAHLLEESQVLATVHQYRKRLQDVWERTATSQEGLLQSLQDWCKQAESTGIQALEDFSRNLRGYLPAVPISG